MIYVTDTHPFLWYISEDERLSKRAGSIFDDAENGNVTIVVPTIVLAESLYLIEEERLLKIKFTDVISKLEIGRNYTTIPLNIKVIKKVEELKKIKELHDRIIVASASILNAELITKDETIIKTGYVKTIW